MDFDQFAAHARTQRVVPVWRQRLADRVTPIDVYAGLVGEEQGFLLESVEQGQRWSRFSFVGRNPLARLITRGLDVDIEDPEGLLPSLSSDKGTFEALSLLLKELSSAEIDDLPPLASGVVGYIGYDTVREVESIPNDNPDELGVPDAVLSFMGDVVIFDHWKQQMYLVRNVIVGEGWDDGQLQSAFDEASHRLDVMENAINECPADPLFPAVDLGDRQGFARAGNNPRFQKAVETAKEYIRAGDIFQVVVAQRFDLELESSTFDVYRVLRQVNPSSHMFLLTWPEVTLVGASPEPLAEVHGGVVTTRPIAGTRWRGRTEEEDRDLAEQLLADPKERAEHVMLVDLARNDLGRVCEFGTVEVDEWMTVERYSHLMHITSQVRGKLSPEYSAVDVVRATLPAGTQSGAPKVRAMEIIDELEIAKRGPYAGIVAAFSFSGDLETALILRTLVVTPEGKASIQAGGGIVLDSDPVKEDLETRNKASAIVVSVEAAKQLTDRRKQ